VVAGGSAPLTFQWQRNGVAIAQATGASYTTPATITNDSGAAFSVVVANSLGTVSSRSAALTVNATAAVVVTFSQRPADTTVAAGAAATFSAAATCSDGSTALYQWDRTDDAGATYTHISQATSATYSFTTSSADNGAKFRVLVTCGATTTSSLLVTLTVTAAAATGPTAAFTAPGTANALAPVALDASASTSADGSALQYVWDFGNGARGGGVKIAHVFAANIHDAFFKQALSAPQVFFRLPGTVGRRQDSRHLAATTCQLQLVIGFIGEIDDEPFSQFHGRVARRSGLSQLTAALQHDRQLVVSPSQVQAIFGYLGVLLVEQNPGVARRLISQ